MQNYPCNKSIEDFPIAMSYVPWQHFHKIYENLEEGFGQGTIFPELNKPFMGRRGNNGK